MIVTVRTTEGAREVPAETIGDELLAVHRTLHGNRDEGAPEWTLSHLPSGYSIVHLAERDDCLAVGRILLELLGAGNGAEEGALPGGHAASFRPARERFPTTTDGGGGGAAGGDPDGDRAARLLRLGARQSPRRGLSRRLRKPPVAVARVGRDRTTQPRRRARSHQKDCAHGGSPSPRARGG